MFFTKGLKETPHTPHNKIVNLLNNIPQKVFLNIIHGRFSRPQNVFNKIYYNTILRPRTKKILLNNILPPHGRENQKGFS